MALTHRITIGLMLGNTSLPNQANTYTANGSQAITPAILNSSVNEVVGITFTASELVDFYLLCDQNLIVKTNSGSLPGNTLNLLAGKPFVWTNDGYFSNPFTTNVNEFFVTNTSGATANLQGYFLVNVTP